MDIVKRENTTLGNQSTVKAMAILELLAQNLSPMRLRDISQALQLNASTAARFLTALQGCGYVDQEPDSQRYYLTYKICRIANMVSGRTSLQSITHPYLVSLSGQFHEALCVSVEQDMTMVYIDVAASQDQTLLSIQRVGNISPMHCTGNGKLLLLNYSPQKLDRFIETRGLHRHTEHTITTREGLVQELEAIRARGFAYDNEECEVGVRCVAFPIRDYTGLVVAGISVTGPVVRMTDNAIQRFQGLLKETAVDISHTLGYAP